MVGNMSFLSLAFTQSATLVFARTLGMALVTPALGGVEVAKTVRVLLAIAITAIVLPGILLDPSLSVDVNLSTSQYFWSLGLNALKEGIIDKEGDTEAILVRLHERMIKADPFHTLIQMNRLDDRDAVGTGELGDAQVKVMPVTLQGFQRHPCHLHSDKGQVN